MTKQNHQRSVLKAGSIAIFVNLLLAVFKIIVGLFSNSIAVMSDALHGLIDTVSGIIVVVSEKLGSSKKLHQDHEKIERYGAIMIAVIILAVGTHIIIESFEKLTNPEEVEYSLPVVMVLIASVITKLVLGRYLKKTGQEVKSDTLVASSVETINDSMISGAVLVSALFYLIWHIDIEAYISLAIAIIIIKLGLELVFSKKFEHHH